MPKALYAKIARYKPNPSFRIEYSDGSFKTFTVHCSPEAARLKLAKIRDQIAVGAFELKDHARNKANLVTIAAFFKKYIAQLDAQLNLGLLKQRTLDHRIDTYAMFTRIIGQSTIVASVKQQHVDNFFIALQQKQTRHGHSYSVETLKSYKRDLHIAWEYAVDKAYASTNPFRKYKLKGKKTNQSRRIISPEEKQRIISRFDQLNAQWQQFAYHIAANTGARRGEIFTLKNTNLFTAEIAGIGAVHGLTLSGKGDKTRKIPIDDFTHELIRNRIAIISNPDQVRAILRKASFRNHELRAQRAASGYLLFEVIRPETITEAFRKIFRSCGINDAHFHDIRKTFTTNSLTQGYSLEAMKEWLGHEDIRTTQGFYGLVEFERMAREMQKIKNS